MKYGNQRYRLNEINLYKIEFVHKFKPDSIYTFIKIAPSGLDVYEHFRKNFPPDEYNWKIQCIDCHVNDFAVESFSLCPLPLNYYSC